jgi:hypothetical protein
VKTLVLASSFKRAFKKLIRQQSDLEELIEAR